MKFEEKLIRLRKEKGWSQEELAERLDVSRQSVSKWEMGASLPEIDKIIAMSELFSVSCDYLLKEDSAEEKNAERDDSVYVAREEALTYLRLAPSAYARIAVAVGLCILSPVTLLLLLALAAGEGAPLGETAAVAWGLTALLAIVALAVVIFVRYGMALTPYEYLKKQKITLDEKTLAEIRAEAGAKKTKYSYGVGIGAGLCVLSAVPLFASLGAGDQQVLYGVCLLLGVCAVGVYLLVRFGAGLGVYATLLSEGEYSDEAKAKNADSVAGIYWCVIVACYLGISFTTSAWGITWIIWPIAAVLFGALENIIALARGKK